MGEWHPLNWNINQEGAIHTVVCKEKFARLSWRYREALWHIRTLMHTWSSYRLTIHEPLMVLFPTPGCSVHLKSTMYALGIHSWDVYTTPKPNNKWLPFRLHEGSWSVIDSQSFLCKLPDCVHIIWLVSMKYSVILYEWATVLSQGESEWKHCPLVHGYMYMQHALIKLCCTFLPLMHSWQCTHSMYKYT